MLMKKWFLAIVVIIILSFSLAAYIILYDKTAENETLNYEYKIVNDYPHDTNAFTEGLVYENGFLYESTGLYGNSTVVKAELETGRTLQVHTLPGEFFGEGITIFGDRIVQLTWNPGRGFVYDKNTFELITEFTYPTEGWGITTDGKNLIMSDGTATLHFWNPETFEKTRQVEVHDSSGPVVKINELEYINGEVYANIWQEEKIAMIDIQTGQVNGWINLTGLYDMGNADPENVANGIAYDAEGGRLFVTGKRWPQLFEIKLEIVG
jgi:glutamine cyclotransferase